MRRPLLAVLAAVTVLTACGPVGGRAVEERAVPAAPVEPGSDAEFVAPRPGMADVRARPFDRAVPDEAGQTVTIFYTSGVEPCSVLDRIEVDTSDEQVTITLYEGRDPHAGDVACIEIAKPKAVLLRLPEALAGRPIVDGAAG